MHAVTIPPLLRDTIPFSRLDQRTSLPLPLARAARDELLEASMRVFKHCASERVRDLALDLIHTVLEADASTRNRGCSSDSPGSKSAEWDHCEVEAGFGPGPGSISQVGVGPTVGVGCHSAHPPSSPPLRRSILEPKTRPRARPAPIPLPVWGSSGSGSGSGSTATATATAQPSTPSPPRPKPRPKPRREMADWVYPYPPYTRRLATPPSTPSTPSPQQPTVRTSPSRGPGGSPPSPLATMSPLLPLPDTEMETEMPTATATRSLPRTPKTKPPSSWPARYVAAPAPAPAPAPVPASASASASVSPPRPPWPAPAAPLAPPTSPTSFRTHAYPLPPAALAPAPAPFFPAHEDQGIKENFDDADFDFSTSLRHAPASTSTSGLASGFKGMYGGMVLPHLSDEEDTPLLIHKLAQAEDRHRRRSVAQRMEPSAASWGGTYRGIHIPLVSDGEGSVALSVVERDKEKERKRTAGAKRRTGRPWGSEESNESFERHRTTREREAGLAAEIHRLTQAVGDLHCRFDEAVADVAERMDEREQREREQERVRGREEGRAQERDKEREREREADHKPEDKGKGRKPARACSPKLEECVDANDTTYVERYGEPQSGTDTTPDAKLDALLGKIPPSLAVSLTASILRLQTFQIQNSSDSGRPTPEGEGDDEVMRLMEAFWARRRRERGLRQFHS